MTTRPRVTHLTLGDRARVAAGVRAAQLRCSITQYVEQLVLADAERAGVLSLVPPRETGSDHV